MIEILEVKVKTCDFYENNIQNVDIYHIPITDTNALNVADKLQKFGWTKLKSAQSSELDSLLNKIRKYKI